jgi:hypothetical protein
MYYPILGQPGPYDAPNYRGICRCGPAYADELPEDHPINRAFLEYVQGHGQRLETREAALRLGEAFRQAGRPCDIVQIDLASSEPKELVPGLLGYDIAQNGWYSLLSWGFQEDRTAPTSGPWAPIFHLINTYFRPLLNENGLFATWSDARFFLDIVEAVSTLAPGTWESEGHEQFEIVQLVEVTPESQAGSGD